MKFVNVRINGFTFHLWAYDSNYIHRILLDNKIEFQNIGSHDTDILPTTVYTLDEFVGLVRRTFPNHSTKKETSMLTSISKPLGVREDKTFSRLMISSIDGIVVLVSEIRGSNIIGVVVGNPSLNFRIGYYSITFVKDSFRDYFGEITLKQE